MYRKIVACYLIVLMLLDISLNTKLSAQGKSHGNGVSVHESLMEGISLQEWGGEAPRGGEGGGAAAEGVAVFPPALEFGRAELLVPHARLVTLVNTANRTLHLASVAGTTHHFHASFFQTKTLGPQANTTFSVVYLGRHEGEVSTQLFIHTSGGVVRYPVSATGAPSPHRLWPLAALQVPLGATLEPELRLYNPTDATIQVSEVYSSAAWVRLRLPGGAESAPRAAWAVPPHEERALVRLEIAQRSPHAAHAYVRIAGNMTGGPLVLALDATGAPPGEYLPPPHVRLRARGHLDPPDTFALDAGNSADARARLDAEVWAARCAARRPPAPPPPPAPRANGGPRATPGASVALLRADLPPRAPPQPVAAFTLDYGRLWREAGAADAAWCAGWVRVGRAAAPFSLRLLRGTLALTPPALLAPTTAPGVARSVSARNLFPEAVRVERVHFPPEIGPFFHTESAAPLVIGAGESATVLSVRLRAGVAAAALLDANVTLRTNLTDYSLPLHLADGLLHIERDDGEGGELRLGAVGVRASLRVPLWLRNRGGAEVCARGARCSLAGASLALEGGGCVGARGRARATLSLVAPARAGALAGAVTVSTEHGDSSVGVSLAAYEGRLVAPPVALDDVAPYVWSRAPLLLDNTMELEMRVSGAGPPPGAPADPALSFRWPEEGAAIAAGAGLRAVGALLYRAEAACAPRCATGLDASSPEGAAWLAREAADPAADEALLAARLAAFPRAPLALPLEVRTDGVARVPLPLSLAWRWPRLLTARPPEAIAGVHATVTVTVRVSNPASVPLLLQAVVQGEGWRALPWRAEGGRAAPFAPRPAYALLAPGARLLLPLAFAPRAPGAHPATLLLRNNLTVVERVPLAARAERPAFTLGGVAPGAALALEAADCGGAARELTLRNAGLAPLRVRDWRVAGAPCAARGFRVRPCAPLALPPNGTRALRLAFAPDWTAARASAELTLRAGGATHAFRLAGAARADLVAECGARAPPPPFDAALRALGRALALLALAGCAALAALDAERALRAHRARAALPPAPARAALDLRALGAAAAAAPAPAPRRRRTPRRRAPPAPDAAAERRAFGAWRAEVSRRAAGAAGAGGAPPRGDASSSSPDRSPPRDAYASQRHDDDDEEGASTGSDSSERSEHSGHSERSGISERSERSERSEHSERSERSEAECERLAEDAAAPAAPAPHPAPAHRPHSTGPSGRRAGGARRAERARPGGGAGAGGGVARAPRPRKERALRRRTEPAPAPRAPPAPPPVRWGASWSSVVSRGAAPPPEGGGAGGGGAPALAPIGSDVRRRCGGASHSLFYYGGGDEAWAAPADAWAGERPAWLWGGAGALRPPPGFAPPVRPYDPFRSLASIWTPAAQDWPPERRTPPPPPPAPQRKTE